MAMVIWHTADAYLDPAARDGGVFTLTRIVGGYAAPLFFLLSGFSLARAREPLREVVRGAWVLLAGVALALFQSAVDRAGILSPSELPALALVALGVAAAMRMTRRRALERGLVIALAVALVGSALSLPHAAATRAALGRFDVLHGIGFALMASACCAHALRHLPLAGRVFALVVLALALTGLCDPLTELGRTHLPAPLAGVFVRGPRAQFALVPWLAYALVGVALGSWQHERPRRGAAAPPRAAWVVAGGALAVLCADAAPSSATWTELGQWTGTPRRLIGNAAMLLFIYGGSAHLPAVPRWLSLLGANSLSAYCIHLELAYGLLGLPLARSLSPLAWLLAAAAVTCITWAVVYARVALRHKQAPDVERKTTSVFPFTLERAEND